MTHGGRGKVMRSEKRQKQSKKVQRKDKLRSRSDRGQISLRSDLQSAEGRGIYSLLPSSISRLLEDFSPHSGCHNRKLDLQMCPLLLRYPPTLLSLLFLIKFTAMKTLNFERKDNALDQKSSLSSKTWCNRSQSSNIRNSYYFKLYHPTVTSSALTCTNTVEQSVSVNSFFSCK